MSFPLVDSDRAVTYQRSAPAQRQSIPISPPSLPIGATEELRNASEVQTQLDTMLRLSQDGIPLTSVVGDAFKKSIDDKYKQVEVYGYSVLELMKMRLMAHIALGAGTGKPIAGAIDRLSKILDIMDHIRHPLPPVATTIAPIPVPAPAPAPVSPRTPPPFHASQDVEKLKKMQEDTQKTTETLNNQLSQLRAIVKANSRSTEKDVDRLMAMQRQMPPAPLPVQVPPAMRAPAELPPMATQVPVVDHERVAKKAQVDLLEAREKLKMYTEKLKEKNDELAKVRERVLSHNESIMRLKEEVRSRHDSEAQMRERLDQIVQKAGKMLKKANKK